MNLHTPKWTPMLGVGVPNELPNLQNKTVGVKTHRLKTFFISLESYWSVNVLNGLASPIWTFEHKLLAKERMGVKLTFWLLTTKSQELTQFCCVQAMCDIPLEISWLGLQLCFRPHCNQRSTHKVMCPQSCGSLSCDNFGTLTWESRDKKPFGCGPCGEAHVL
jgi:hypothetical protein